ncbi:uncharacterized protein [Euwallacea fornicatus]|uniref:uncharacterized protein n=1 Tax=Euwallacea fornicatus TaxID=995702 RepID=UPI003390651C
MSEDGFTLELMTESFCSLHGTSLMSEYAAFLQNFLDSENADQHTLKEIQALMLEHDLEPSFEENLAANVENYEKQLQLIKGKSDNLTIQLTAKKEANKVDAAEKKSLIERFYAVECEKANKDLQKSSEKWDKIGKILAYSR